MTLNMNTMKRTGLKILALFFILLSSGVAQDFEGTVSFDIKVTGDMAAQLQPMMPTKYTWYIKDGKYAFTQEGGMAAAMLGSKVVINPETGDSYFINDAQKTVLEIPAEAAKEAQKKNNTQVKVTDLGKTETVAGHKCKKYKVVISSDQGDQTQWLWVAEDIKITPPKENVNAASGFLYKEIQGFPLKIIQEIKDYGVTMTITASEVKKGGVSDEIFEIPKNYKKKSMEDLQKEMGGR